MNSDKIKEIWKENAVRQIDNYTEAEITSIVLKSARKAIGLSYPGLLFWAALLLVNLFLVWVMMNYTMPRLQTYSYALMAAILVLLLGAACISEWGRKKVQRYSFDMPLKEWVESRIREFDKGIERFKRNWFWKYGIGVACLLLFCLIYILTVGFSLKHVLLQLASGLTTLFIAATIANRIFLKRMTKTHRKLQELYEQLKED